MTYRAIRLLAQAAKAEKKSKQFWRILNDPKRRRDGWKELIGKKQLIS